jgi:hypothetical protein
VLLIIKTNFSLFLTVIFSFWSISVRHLVISKFNVKGLLAFIALLLSFSMFLFPILISPGDAWDGAIISYAASIQNFDGIKNWFFESGWPLQYVQIVTFDAMSNILGVKYNTVNSVVLILLMVLCSFEVYILSKDRLRHSKYISCMSVVIFLVFPTWFVLSSNVMLYHFLCLTCALTGLRFFRHSNFSLNIIGLLLVTFSYTLSSLVMFIPALSLLCDSSDKKESRVSIKKNIVHYFSVTYKTVVVSVIGIMVFTCNKYFYPSNGLYDGYNEIVSVASISGLLVYKDNLVNYLSFIKILLPFVSVCLLLLLSKSKSIISPILFILKRNTLFILLFCSVFPYVAVGKSTTLLDGSFNIRQSLLLGVPIALLTAELYAYFYKEFSEHKVFLGGKLPAIFVMCVVLIYSGVSVKKILYFKDRVEIKNGIVNSLVESVEPINQGVVNILSNKLPEDYFRTYEVNYMMYLAFNKAIWFARVGRNYDDNFNIPKFIFKDEKYQIKYIYSPHGMDFNKTVVDVNFYGSTATIKSVKIIN